MPDTGDIFPGVEFIPDETCLNFDVTHAHSYVDRHSLKEE